MFSRITGPLRPEPLGPLDPRTNAWRPDIAEASLAPLISVSLYAEAVVMQALHPVAMVAAPETNATPVSELLAGERFAVLDINHGYAWGYAVDDHYVGYVPMPALVGAVATANWRIGHDALIFHSPSIKAPVTGTLPMGSIVHGQEYDEKFILIQQGPHAGGYLHKRHLHDEHASRDWVEIAQSFVGAPYRWGGRSRAGIDCSGLVQIARQMAGHFCPRDSDMQAALARPTEKQPERGNIVYWPGHIGIMVDKELLLHANAHHMACLIEPLEDVIARARNTAGQDLSSIRQF